MLASKLSKQGFVLDLSISVSVCTITAKLLMCYGAT